MHIERFDPVADEPHLRACHEMAVAGQPIDDPDLPPMTLSFFRGWWAFGFSNNPLESWIATNDAGEPVGCYLLELPDRENRSNSFGFIIVDPPSRRRGIGTALLGHMAAQAARSGRRVLMSETRGAASGSAFAAATGGVAGLRDARRILDVDAELRARLTAIRADARAHAAGYRLRCWQGGAPPELLDGLAAVYTAMGDAPHDDVFEPEIWDTSRLKAAEERVRMQGTRWYSVTALAPDGEVAAITQVNVDPAMPGWGWQELTAVIGPHRGHRLGLLVKVAMLDLLAAEEPGLRRMMTSNADSNVHMIAINERLGYKETDYMQAWEHDVARTAALA